MDNKENGFLFYFILGVIYAVVFGGMIGLFNLFTEEKTPLPSLIFQSIFFGIFMTLFEMWLRKRKKKKDDK